MLETLKTALKGKKVPLRLEQDNFKIGSTGWKKIIVDGEKYLVNFEGDVWEFASGEYKGEQLFTWDAAIRETKKAGKRMPTDEEFTKILRNKLDISNLVLAGNRYTSGSFSNRSTYAYFWSSSQYDASLSWYRLLSSGNASVNRYSFNKANGFSVRCLKN